MRDPKLVIMSRTNASTIQECWYEVLREGQPLGEVAWLATMCLYNEGYGIPEDHMRVFMGALVLYWLHKKEWGGQKKFDIDGSCYLWTDYDRSYSPAVSIRHMRRASEAFRGACDAEAFRRLHENTEWLYKDKLTGAQLAVAQELEKCAHELVDLCWEQKKSLGLA